MNKYEVKVDIKTHFNTINNLNDFIDIQRVKDTQYGGKHIMKRINNENGYIKQQYFTVDYFLKQRLQENKYEQQLVNSFHAVNKLFNKNENIKLDKPNIIMNKDGTWEVEKQEHSETIVLVKNFAILQNQDKIFFLSEYLPGVTLQDFLFDIGAFQVYEITYYMARMLKIFEEISINREVIHRNYSPSCFLILENGQMRLQDYFKSIESDRIRNDKVSTIVGLPIYSSPELLKGQNYSIYSDLWALGICFYEMVCGYYPFDLGSVDDPMDLTDKLAQERLYFPDYVKNNNLKDLIMQLLDKRSEQNRLSNTHSSEKSILEGFTEGILEHQFFSDENFWEKLAKNEYNPPALLPNFKKLQKCPASAIKLAESKKIPILEKIPSQRFIRALSNDMYWDENFGIKFN